MFAALGAFCDLEKQTIYVHLDKFGQELCIYSLNKHQKDYFFSFFVGIVTNLENCGPR